MKREVELLCWSSEAASHGDESEPLVVSDVRYLCEWACPIVWDALRGKMERRR